MKGAVFLGDRKVELRDFATPEPRDGEVVIAIRASGLCGSDLHQFRQENLPEPLRIAGHEPAGEVLEVGAGVLPSQAHVGQRVMVHHYAACNTCEQCRSGWPQLCQDQPITVFGTDAHGAHAEYMAVPAASLVPLDESLSFAAGASIGCGTGTAWGALERLGDIGGATLAVFGQGPVGLSASLLAAARGARVIAIDPQASRRDEAARLGAWSVIDPLSVDPVAAIKEVTHGRGAQFVIETSGDSTATRQALESIATWGKICIVGLGGEVRFKAFDFFKTQMTLVTSWSMSIVDQARCARFIVEQNVGIQSLITHRWKLEEVGLAYQALDSHIGGKGVIVF